MAAAVDRWQVARKELLSEPREEVVDETWKGAAKAWAPTVAGDKLNIVTGGQSKPPIKHSLGCSCQCLPTALWQEQQVLLLLELLWLPVSSLGQLPLLDFKPVASQQEA